MTYLYGKSHAFKLVTKYVVENDPDKIDFILTNHPEISFVFADVHDVADKETVYCYRHKRYVAVPYVSIITYGFSCQSKSKANPKAKLFKNCVQKGIGKTGNSFKAVQIIIKRFRPEITIGENLTRRDRRCRR